MSSFSITHLEAARKNPAVFAKTISSNSGQNKTPFNRYPQSMRWLNAISKYHNSNDINQAINYIENWFDTRKDNAVNKRALRKFIEALGNYEDNVVGKKYNLVNSREAINIEIRSIKITGIIPIIYMKPSDGFAAYFISRKNASWSEELKYPIIQNYIATNIFNVDPAVIDVGYIDFTTGELYETCYSKRLMKEAQDDLKNITDIIIDNL